MGSTPDAAGRSSGDLERDHAAERAAGDERDAADAQCIEQAPLGARLVAGRDRREALRRTAAGRRVARVGPVVP